MPIILLKFHDIIIFLTPWVDYYRYLMYLSPDGMEKYVKVSTAIGRGVQINRALRSRTQLSRAAMESVECVNPVAH